MYPLFSRVVFSRVAPVLGTVLSLSGMVGIDLPAAARIITANPTLSTSAQTPTVSSSKLAAAEPGLLSSKQKAELTRLKIPVVIPTYLPADFKLVKVDQGVEPYTTGDVYWYSLFYRSRQGTCLEIAMNADPAMRLSGLQQSIVTTPIGSVKVYSGTVEKRPLLLGLATLPNNTGLLLRSGGAIGSYQGRCDLISTREYIKVLKSLQRLK